MYYHYLLRFIFIALLLLVSQFHTVHSGKHALKKIEECQACQSSKYIDTKKHETSLLSFFVSLKSEFEQLQQHRVLKEPIDIEQKVESKYIDFIGMKYLEVPDLPLGFDATAPPLFFA